MADLAESANPDLSKRIIPKNNCIIPFSHIIQAEYI